MISNTPRGALAAPVALLLWLTVLPTQTSAHVAAEGSARATYDFNPGWRLLVGDPAGAERIDFDDSAWKWVTLPRAWNEDSAFKVSIEELPTGVAWYRKRLALPAAGADKKVFLEFEGVRHAADVYVNGHHAVRH